MKKPQETSMKAFCRALILNCCVLAFPLLEVLAQGLVPLSTPAPLVPVAPPPKVVGAESGCAECRSAIAESLNTEVDCVVPVVRSFVQNCLQVCKATENLPAIQAIQNVVDECDKPRPVITDTVPVLIKKTTPTPEPQKVRTWEDVAKEANDTCENNGSLSCGAVALLHHYWPDKYPDCFQTNRKSDCYREFACTKLDAENIILKEYKVCPKDACTLQCDLRESRIADAPRVTDWRVADYGGCGLFLRCHINDPFERCVDDNLKSFTPGFCDK